jgi:hypothetical protein
MATASRFMNEAKRIGLNQQKYGGSIYVPPRRSSFIFYIFVASSKTLDKYSQTPRTNKSLQQGFMPILTGAYAKSRLIDLLIEFKVRQFDCPFCKERSIYCIDR